MSLRVKKVEPVCSAKSSTQNQYDSLRFWRSKIAQSKSKEETLKEKSFRDVLLSISEASQTSQEDKK